MQHSKTGRLMSESGHNRRLPHRSIGVRFCSVSRHHLTILAALAPERFGRQAAALATPKGRRIAPTCTCVHVLPRAVLTLRSLSLTAMWTTTSSHVCRREHLSGVCLLCLPLLGRCYGRTIAAMIMLNLRKLRMNE